MRSHGLQTNELLYITIQMRLYQNPNNLILGLLPFPLSLAYSVLAFAIVVRQFKQNLLNNQIAVNYVY